jgi:hypothetical protein
VASAARNPRRGGGGSSDSASAGGRAGKAGGGGEAGEWRPAKRRMAEGGVAGIACWFERACEAWDRVVSAPIPENRGE